MFTKQRPNLFLAFDAFGTLFAPKEPIAKQYSDIARRHGLSGFSDEEIKSSFHTAFRRESKLHPNYGRDSGLGAQAWWENIIENTFRPFLKDGRNIPWAVTSGLLHRFASCEGYTVFPDVLPFFSMLRGVKGSPSLSSNWPWERTVVGIITNSDDRVPGILRSFGLKVASRRVGITYDPTIIATEDDDISFTVLSYDVGFEKPQRPIFDMALRLLDDQLAKEPYNTSASIDSFEKLYVGDDHKKDYIGAIEAGWNALYIDRAGHLSQYRPNKEALVTVADYQDPGIDLKVIWDLKTLSEWTPKEL
ncbi:haloacid dehalogenase [Pseudovirgaria hyperparasitica]|uniref:Haloacid dehalogenase n=1 Tax=Pseudovirgaria hyperparasitica TaxID=470096 RepID=A0A6A6WGQ7_9PEZI|nr:haloacid dehalogenase [Pseudovirgaria hyperparasitica]KAF2761264.1 haloacid dehalogenase [Pseudovirgaria hyperparasitica]